MDGRRDPLNSRHDPRACHGCGTVGRGSVRDHAIATGILLVEVSAGILQKKLFLRSLIQSGSFHPHPISVNGLRPVIPFSRLMEKGLFRSARPPCTTFDSRPFIRPQKILLLLISSFP